MGRQAGLSISIPMAGNGRKEARDEEAFAMSDTSATSSSAAPYLSSMEEEETHFNYTPGRPRRSVVGKVVDLLGINSRGSSHDYFVAPREDLLDGVLKKTPQRELRRCRRGRVVTLVKKAILACPVVLLLLFGVLHVLQVVMGRAQLFWDVDPYEDFLPNWGKMGHVGEGLSKYPTDATRDVLPIPCHSHNDYWRRVPLFDAVRWGCTGVEADVWQFDDELYIGHDLASLSRNRTFRNLYVNPLVDLLDRMNPTTDFTTVTGQGVFDEKPEQTLVLLVDIKSHGRTTVPVLSRQLAALREKDYLTYWDGNKLHTRAVTVVGTGNTPFDLITANNTHRDIFFDAPLDKLWELPRPPIPLSDPAAHARDADLPYGEAMTFLPPRNSTSPTTTTSQQDHATPALAPSTSDYNTSTSYYASTSFAKTIGFVWRGHLSPRQMEILRGQIRGAKRRGLKARYWDTPAWPLSLRNHVWHVLMKEGADVLNVDDLKGAATENWRMRTHEWWS